MGVFHIFGHYVEQNVFIRLEAATGRSSTK